MGMQAVLHQKCAELLASSLTRDDIADICASDVDGSLLGAALQQTDDYFGKNATKPMKVSLLCLICSATSLLYCLIRSASSALPYLLSFI